MGRILKRTAERVKPMTPFSIIVPVYNEEAILRRSIQTLIQYADNLDSGYEIIVVSNGSTDTSDVIGAALARQHAQVKYYSIPEKGVGRAFKKGIKASRYDHIIFIDADLSADLTFIRLANQHLAGNALVLGTKINGLQNRSLFRKFGSLVFYLSVRFIMGMQYVDYAPGAKAYQKSFLKKYFTYIDDYTSFVLNLTYIATIKKIPLVEIPIVCDDRRESRFNLWREAVSKYRGLVTLKYKQIMDTIE